MTPAEKILAKCSFSTRKTVKHYVEFFELDHPSDIEAAENDLPIGAAAENLRLLPIIRVLLQANQDLAQTLDALSKNRALSIFIEDEQHVEQFFAPVDNTLVLNAARMEKLANEDQSS
jgi:hypothetical protein